MKISILFLLVATLSSNKTYAGDGTTGSSCDDGDGSCGGPWSDVDCAAGYVCVNPAETPPAPPQPGTCQPSAACTITCGDSGTFNECDEEGGCSQGQQCGQDVGGNWQCITPPLGSCGNVLPDGSPCTYDYQCAGGSCTVQQNGGGICGGQGCIPYGNVCVSGGTPVPGGCCGGVNCTQYTDGNSYCGDPFAIFDEPITPNEYDGSIVDYESFLQNMYRLMLPIAIGLLGIPTVAIASYTIMTSQGDPMKVKRGIEELTAAISGLLFLLLALSILRIILKNFLGQ